MKTENFNTNSPKNNDAQNTPQKLQRRNYISDTQNSLKAIRPDLAAEWHPTKNGELTPDMVKSGSKKSVWWKCKEGHEWKARIESRSEGYGCPYCSGNLCITGKDDLYTTAPELAAKWHPTKNGDLTPDMVKKGSQRVVWWKCENGHEWKERIYTFNKRGGRCLYCSGKKAIKGMNDLQTTNPELAAEWHPTKNGSLTPDMVTETSKKRVWWQCKNGHEWNTKIAARSIDKECPYCAEKILTTGVNDLQTANPKLAAEWHPTKNGDLTPDKVFKGSRQMVWWKCKNGHEWEEKVSYRHNKGYTCPYCSGRKFLKGYNDLKTIRPDLASEWHPTKNGELTAEDVLPRSNRKVWWLGKCGHEWEAGIIGRYNGGGCPYCFGRVAEKDRNDLQTVNPELAAEWHPTKNGNLTPNMVKSKSHKKVWWKCKNGHEWEARIESRSEGRGCPYCSGKYPIMGKNDLRTLYPEIAEEWHPTKNKDMKAENVMPHSNRKVWWLGKCGHEWEDKILYRTEGKGCPYCKK